MLPRLELEVEVKELIKQKNEIIKSIKGIDEDSFNKLRLLNGEIIKLQEKISELPVWRSGLFIESNTIVNRGIIAVRGR